MALCPACNTRIPLKQVLKTTDILLFPDQGAEQCAVCQSKLVPTSQSALASVFAFLAIAAVCFALLYFAHLGTFLPGFLCGLGSGLTISFGGLWATGKLLRFRGAADDR